MRTFFRVFKTEILKNRRTFANWVTLLFPLFTVTLVTLAFSGMKITAANPWLQYNYNFNSSLSFFYPFFLVILIAYTIYLENKSNTWKLLLSQPISKLTVFSGKLSMILFFVILSYLYCILMAYLSSCLLHLINPEKFHFIQGGIPLKKFSLYLGKTYLSGLLILVLQYWISLRFKNLVVPIIIGIGMIILPVAILIIMGMTGLLNQPKSLEHVFNYDPYSYPFAPIFNFLKGPATRVVLMPTLSWIYLGLAVCIGFLSFLDFRKRNF